MRADQRRVSLPVDGVLPELLAHLESAKAAVLEATPGSGKTTRVPPALLAAGFRGDREVIVLEPRRLAAKMAAHRVAEELGERVGETVGYQFRFENVGGPKTRIRFLTEGMFVRRLLSDPQLSRVAVVVVDEFHERHLQGDVALASLKRLQQGLRPDLRIVVMSATLETEAISKYLEDARVFSIAARRFEVAIDYLDLPEDDWARGRRGGAPAASCPPSHVLAGVKRLLEDEGDILVFLPGVADIRRSQKALEALASANDLLILPLYGDLSKEEQDRAVRPARSRKIILSTNVAETSLTIEGVRNVVDSGLARVASYSYWSGLPALRTKPVSKASAIQRAGRAGRTAPGRCVRLYSKQSFESRSPFETPEIQRADLAQTLLELAALGVRDPLAFPWFESPLGSAVEASAKLLVRLGALKDGLLTELGRRMAEMPAHPRLARLVLEGDRMGIARETATLAAMLSEGQYESLDLLADFERYQPLGTAERARDQLLRNARRGPGPASAPDPGHRGLRKALLVAFPDRVARLRKLAANVARNTTGQKAELVLAAGGSATLEDTGLLTSGAEYFVTVDIEERAKSQCVCRAICSIEPEWLFDLEPEGVVEQTEVLWDSQRQRALATTRMLYDGLVMDESKGVAAEDEVAAVLAREAVAAGLGMFVETEKLEQLKGRLRFVREQLPDPTLPELDGPGLERFLRRLCAGKSSFAELRESDLYSQILFTLEAEARARLDRMAPESIRLPGGRNVRVHYEPGKPPWIESRLQDFFGMKTGPTVLGGRLPVTIHLLAPNMRAVQVTSDLAGFWTRVYPELRRELGRRYPRHSWPEDPFTAEPPAPRGRR